MAHIVPKIIPKIDLQNTTKIVPKIDLEIITNIIPEIIPKLVLQDDFYKFKLF